jgi:hypothetical protein
MTCVGVRRFILEAMTSAGPFIISPACFATRATPYNSIRSRLPPTDYNLGCPSIGHEIPRAAEAIGIEECLES